MAGTSNSALRLLTEMLTHLGDIYVAVLMKECSQLDGATLPPVMLCGLAAHDARDLLEDLAHPLSTCTSRSLLLHMLSTLHQHHHIWQVTELSAGLLEKALYR